MFTWYCVQKYAFRCGGNHIFKTIYRSVLIATLCFYVGSSSIMSLTQLLFFFNGCWKQPLQGIAAVIRGLFRPFWSIKMYPSWMSLDVYMVMCWKQCVSLWWQKHHKDKRNCHECMPECQNICQIGCQNLCHIECPNISQTKSANINNM